MTDMRRVEHSQLLMYRSLFYMVLVMVLSYSNQHFLDEYREDTIKILLVITVLTIGQMLLNFKHVQFFEWIPFILADQLISMKIVKITGASSSPFLVLFPIISLAGSVVFKGYLFAGLVGTTMIFMYFSVGWNVAIIQNAIAIVTSGLLGHYLTKTLSKTDVALKTVEEANKRLQDLQRAILFNIPSGLMSINVEGKVIQVNPMGSEILGIERNDILNKSIKDILPNVGKEITELNTLVPTMGTKNLATERTTVGYSKPSGEQINLGFTATRLQQRDSRFVLGTLVIFQDLTRITSLEESSRRNEKLAAVGKLAASIAHEIRNPLASISGSAQMLKDVSGLEGEDRILLDIITRESARLDDLINEFLVYVRPQQMELESVDLVDICRHLKDNMSVNPKWQAHKANIDVKVDKEHVICRGDENKITQVLSNFVVNAAEAGASTVELIIDERPSITVRDNGSGISEENIKRLFEPFFTTKEKGTGLGLAICFRILESMYAQVKVTSPVADFKQGGTDFTIRFKGDAV